MYILTDRCGLVNCPIYVVKTKAPIRCTVTAQISLFLHSQKIFVLTRVILTPCTSYSYMSHVTTNLSSEFPNRFDKNRGVKPQKMFTVFKFRISEGETLLMLCSEN